MAIISTYIFKRTWNPTENRFTDIPLVFFLRILHQNWLFNLIDTTEVLCTTEANKTLSSDACANPSPSAGLIKMRPTHAYAPDFLRHLHFGLRVAQASFDTTPCDLYSILFRINCFVYLFVAHVI